MAAPEGYNALGKIGISYKGDYDSNTTYERLDAVEHNGSTYLAIKDAPDGAPRDDKVNWIYLAKGFSGDIGDSEITFTEAENRENINTGESVKTVFGKIKKFFADLTAPAFAQMITTKEDLLATKATGYVPDAKAVADAYTELNGKLAKYKIDKISVNKPDLAIGTNIIDGTTFTLSKGIYFITIKVQGISAITRNDQRIEFWFGNTKRRSISQASLPHNTPYPVVAFGSFMNVVDEDTVNVYSHVDTTTLSLFSVDMEIIKLLG